MGTAPEWNKQVYSVPVGQNIILEGNLNIPAKPRGTILFVHGSGSGRQSTRNQYVAHRLYVAGFATLLIDLLTSLEEDQDAYNRQLSFDIQLLSKRVLGITNWLVQQHETQQLKIGYFGASTGAAAALVAAARCADVVGAVVSRGGRPDLAGSALSRVQVPTLFIVGSLDTEVWSLNQKAAALLPGEKKIEIINGASHLFEEPGKLEQVAQLAGQWFTNHL